MSRLWDPCFHMRWPAVHDIWPTGPHGYMKSRDSTGLSNSHYRVLKRMSILHISWLNECCLMRYWYELLICMYMTCYVLGFHHWVATHINRKIFPQILWDSWAILQGYSYQQQNRGQNVAVAHLSLPIILHLDLRSCLVGVPLDVLFWL